MTKIYENSKPYLLSKAYVLWTFKQYYNKVIIRGLEHIPEDEAVIFAPNHQNALMDALAILALPPFKQPKVFLARADLFNLKKAIVKFIAFTKIMPAFRIRDGYENLSKNQTSFATADEALLNHAAMCIMPEGNQELDRRIRPLVKGIFRIAFSAQQKMPADKSVHIIPVGLDYEDYVKNGDYIIINIGESIKVADYMAIYNENPARAINSVKDKLFEQLKTLTLNIHTTEYYESFMTAIEATNDQFGNELQSESTIYKDFTARMQTAEALNKFEENANQEQLEQFAKLCKRYKEGMQKVKIDTETLLKGSPTIGKYLLNSFKILLNFILSLPGLLLNIVPFAIVSIFPKFLKIKFIGFYSSVYYVASIIIFPLLYLLQSIAITALSPIPWWSIFLLLPLQFHLGKISMRLFRSNTTISKEQRFFRAHQSDTSFIKNLLQLRVEIYAML